MHKPSKELQNAFKSIIDEFRLNERSVRERQIRLWKKLSLYWDGFQRTWWDETAHDYRTFNTDLQSAGNLDGSAFFDRPINVYQAYLSTIIAALSATTPPVKCVPDDADNPADITTARGGTKIAELIAKHNDAPLLWVKALWIYTTQGMIAAYNRTVEKEEFGTVDVEEHLQEEQILEFKTCPLCGKELAEQELLAAEDLAANENDEFDKDEEDVPSIDLNNQSEEQVLCPECAVLVQPDINTERFIVEKLVGRSTKPKARQIIEVHGGLYVFVPNYVRSQEELPILGYCRELHYTNVYEMFPHLAKEHDFRSAKSSSFSGNEQYEVWGRLSNQYLGEYPMDTPTVGSWWLRPRTYWMIEDDEIRKEAEKYYPFGVRVDIVNDIFAQATPEDLDDHWTIAVNPLSNYLHYDPLGLLATSVQDITTDLIDLTMQTIEQGVGQTFADPSVLNFEQYGKQVNLPGSVFPAKPKSGKSLGDAFFQISTATLGREVEPFGEKINQLGQFVTGALPALFGGAGPSSQRTASQQTLSRNQALQRLQTPWKMINYWWQKIFGKVIPAYIETMLDDERLVRKQHGTYVNDLIKRSQLDGKIGEVTVESSDQLPQTWAQTRDIIMQMLASNNPLILEALANPDNLGVLQSAIGLLDFNIPGEKDREKQYHEIKLLLQAAPIEDPNTGEMLPSIMPELLVDNHKVEGDICRDWLVSEAGLIAQVENKEGYENVKAHLEVHIRMLQELNAGTQQPEPAGPSKAGVQPNAGRNFRPGEPATNS